MTASRQAEPLMTATAFRSWTDLRSDDLRHELLDGVPFAMGSERAIHARTKAGVFRQFERGIAEAGLPCEAFVDGMAVRVDDANVFEPDALVRCGARLPDDAIWIEDPLIVVEVVSPSTQRVDVLAKFARYFRNPHILHYLIVVPTDRIVIHHRRVGADHIESVSHESGTITLDPPGLSLVLAELFPTAA